MRSKADEESKKQSARRDKDRSDQGTSDANREAATSAEGKSDGYQYVGSDRTIRKGGHIGCGGILSNQAAFLRDLIATQEQLLSLTQAKLQEIEDLQAAIEEQADQ